MNYSTGLILSLESNFKLYENIKFFCQLQIKFNKLNHQINSKSTIDTKNVTNEYIISVAEEYYAIYEIIEYNFPNHI